MTGEAKTSFEKAFDEQRKPVDYFSLLQVSRADSVDLDDEVFDDELIERVLHKKRVATMYGNSNCGKTFVALDMAFSIALGRPWMGRKVRQGSVLYIATESPASIRKRIKAYKKRHGIECHIPIYVAEKPLNFFGGDSDAQDVISLINQIEDETGEAVLLTIGDTLAQMSAGANENAGTDMSLVMANAEIICRETDSAFEWIHHSGKNTANGQRGWSGMRAHIATEIEVSEVEGEDVRRIEITKQRDGEGKGDTYGFTLEPVPVGKTGFGNIATSCVIVQESPPEKDKPQGKNKPLDFVKSSIAAIGSTEREKVRRQFMLTYPGSEKTKNNKWSIGWNAYMNEACQPEKVPHD